MIKWRGIGDGRSNAGLRIAREVVWNRNQFFNLQVTVGAQGFERFHIGLAAEKQRIVNRYQITAVINERTHFIDQLCLIIRQINNASVCSCKEWRVNKD